AGARCGASNEHLPFVEDVSLLRDLLPSDVAHAAVSVDLEVRSRPGRLAPERAVEAERTDGTHQVHESLCLRKGQRRAATGLDGGDLLQDRQSLVEADEDVSAVLKQRSD